MKARGGNGCHREMFAKPKQRKGKEKRSELQIFRNILRSKGRKVSSLKSDDNIESSEAENTTSTKSSNISVTPSDDNIRRAVPVVSLKLNTNDSVFLSERESRIGYKVLAIKEDVYGSKIIFDITEGTVYNCTATKKITNFVPLYDNQIAALNERFVKNDKNARILASFG